MRSPLVSLGLGLLLGLGFAARGSAGEEADLLDLLRSAASPVDKAEACRRLRRVATPAAVPTLAAQLTDERVGPAARHALEVLPFPEATRALREALPHAGATLQLGLVDSLGWRRDADAVPALRAWLEDPRTDPALAAACATALGRIASVAAWEALRTVHRQHPPAAGVGPAVIDALLAATERRLAEGPFAEATGVYEALTDPAEDPATQIAAHVALLRTAGAHSLEQLEARLRDPRSAAQAAALTVLNDRNDAETAQVLAKLVPGGTPSLQAALLQHLRRLAVPSTLPVVLAAVNHPEPTVRVAALAALGEVGDASCLLPLAEAAASNRPADQGVARQSLLALYRGEITTSLLQTLPTTSGAVQRELFRALTARADRTAVPQLLRWARQETPGLRTGALQALGALADARHLEALVALLTDAPDAPTRDEIRGVFESLIERTPEPARLDVTPLLQALAPTAASSTETRAALLQIGAPFADGRFREAFRAALRGPEPPLKSAAARALCFTHDPGLLPDLLAVARTAESASLRSLALEGYVRLATEDTTTLDPAARSDALAQAWALDLHAEDQRRVLSGLARVPHLRALELAESAAQRDAVRAPAQFAALQIAQSLAPANFPAVEPALQRLATGAVEGTTQTNALALLRQLNSGWLAIGPFRQEGRTGEELFNVVFPPETNTTATLPWQRAPGSADLARPDDIQLGGFTGGDHCVVYARTRVESPAEQRVRFLLGSDDGIKLWVNGTLVHANNAVRGLTPGQDQASGSLVRGPNELLVKVTQHTAGCGFSIRILTPEGTPVTGLRFDPRAP